MLARTSSPDDTRALAAALAGLLRAGDVILLSGEMGAGKTAFTQGLGAALGVEERITSPTFTIAATYETGRLRLHHLDVYRLEHLNEALDVGLGEMVDDDAVVVVEWGDAIAPVLPPDHLELRITFAPLDASGEPSDAGPGPGAAVPADLRTWEVRPLGPRWTARSGALRAALGQWSVDEPC